MTPFDSSRSYPYHNSGKVAATVHSIPATTRDCPVAQKIRLNTFFRKGDGKVAVGQVIREYLISEAMHRLSTPTTHALSAVPTGAAVPREPTFQVNCFRQSASAWREE